MAIVTASTARTFIKAARLPKPLARARAMRGPTDAPVELKDTDAQVLVVGSSLVAAADQVPAQTREDLVNCTLFAQLSASGSVADQSDVSAWYGEYFQALSVLGWAQSDRRFEEFQSSGTHLEAHKSIIKVLAALLGPQAAVVTLVTQTLEALQSMDENNPWITLFQRESTTVKSARFQVATAQKTAGGLIEIALVAFDLHSKNTLTQVLFFKFKKNSTSLKYAQGNATIYEAVLAQNRQQIADRLTAYRTSYIAEVKFPPRPGRAVRGKPSIRRRSSKKSA